MQSSQLLLKEAQDKELLALLREREALWEKESPSVFSRMIDRKASEDWLEHRSIIRKERIAVLDELHKW